MRNSIIYFEKEGRIITGNICISMPSLVEVRILSPFNGLVLQRTPEDLKEFTDEQQNQTASDLLQKGFEILSIINANNKIIGKDFLQLLTNLENFNNDKSEIYIRNRDELLRVFMRAYFAEFVKVDNPTNNYCIGISNFLSLYYINNGKCADLDISTTFNNNSRPPTFHHLEQKLKEYLAKSFEEKLFLLAQQSVNKKSSEYDWFLLQEFVVENNNL